MAKEGPPLAAPSPPIPTVARTPKPELKLPPQKSFLKSGPVQPTGAQLSGAVASTARESRTAEDYRSAALVAGAASATSPPAAAVVGGADESGAATTAAMQNSFAPRPTDKPQGAATTRLHLPGVQLRAVNAAHPQWRITPDGHLERLGVSGTWTRALADQITTFHVVSVVGDNIWAGGSGGALFHSSDDGQHWSRVALATPSSRETGTIVSIQFRDALQGVVSTEAGSQWNTSDGGFSWARH